MKTLLNFSAITFVLIAFLGMSTLTAQEWTKEQKEVWNEVEQMWENWKAGDLDAAFANVHEKYLGWNDEMPLPVTKAEWVEPMKEYISKVTNRDYYASPARILVIGNAAVVHYYYQMSWIYDDGDQKKPQSYKGKWSEFFIKEGGKWMLIGDMTVGDADKD